MNAQTGVELIAKQWGEYQGVLRRLARLLGTILSAPRGDQGGWEAGARGL